MSLTDKIFNLGIYGGKPDLFTADELEEIKKLTWVELLSPTDLNSFKSTFTLSSYTNYNALKCIPSDCYIRMNLHTWRAYIFGAGFITKNKYYFEIIDYLLKSMEEVDLSVLRSKLEIDPKTMFYLCKKLKEYQIITENRKGKDTVIKICKLTDRIKVVKKEVEVQEQIIEKEVKNYVYFQHMKFIDQLKYHAINAADGIGSKEITKICGMSSKAALSYMYKLCALDPVNFKLIDSIDQKHTVFKVFSIENLNNRNQRKLEMMKTGNGIRQDLLLSSNDRQKALIILAEKYNHFRLSKDIIDEISKMTGYPYAIDRKNLIKNAEEAGLRVFKLPNITGFKYLIALPEYDESIVERYTHKAAVKKENEGFFKLVKKFFLYGEFFTSQDNGYCTNVEVGRTILYNVLEEQPYNKFHFDYELISKITVGVFFKIVKTKKTLFKSRCAFDIFINLKKDKDKSLGIIDTDRYDLESFYTSELKSKKIAECIYEIEKTLDKLDLKTYINLVSGELQNYLRELSKPLKFVKKLNGIQKNGLIDLTIDKSNRIFITMLESSKECKQSYSNYEQPNLTYNTRVKFVELMHKASEQSFFGDSRSIIAENFSHTDQRLLHEAIKKFRKDPKEKLRKKAKTLVLSENLKKIYLNIKKLIVFKLPVSVKALSEHEYLDVIETLEYMAKKEMIAGYRSASTINSTVINHRHKSYVSSKRFKSIPSNTMYFSELLPKIKNIVSSAGSIDIDNILITSKFIEEFELQMLFKEFPEEFIIKEVDGFKFISITNLQDPFE